MRHLVLDASAVAELVLRTPAGVALDGILTGDEVRLHTPALCSVELTSILRRSLLTSRLTVERAAEALDDYLILPLDRHDHVRFLGRILVLRDNFSAYDACYVALAETLGAALVTADSRLADSVRRHLDLDLVEVHAD